MLFATGVETSLRYSPTSTELSNKHHQHSVRGRTLDSEAINDTQEAGDFDRLDEHLDSDITP